MKKLFTLFYLLIFGAIGIATHATTFTAELMTGDAWKANIYVGNANYDFYDDNNPRTITTEADEEIFITTTDGTPYQVLVDGKTIPTDMWDYSETYFIEGYTLAPGSEYFPEENGRIEIYINAPQSTDYEISFNFVVEGTENFVSDLMVDNLYYRDADFADAMSNGLRLAEGTELGLTFNTLDYQVNFAKVNGNDVATTETYHVTVTEDLKFDFDVTPVAGRSFTIVSSGWRNLTITDASQNTYNLTGETTVLNLANSVDRLRIAPVEGYEIPVGGVEATTGSTTTTTTNDDIIAYPSYFVISFDEADYTRATVLVKQTGSDNSATYIFNCEADVMQFSGYPSNPTAIYIAGTGSTSGYYRVTNIPATSLSAEVKEEFRADYVIENVSIIGETTPIPSYNGYSFAVPMYQLSGDTEFTINFNHDAKPRFITVNVDNPSCVSRVYSENSGNITSFPAQYDLNTGLTLYIEAANECRINNIVINGNQYASIYPAETVEVDLTGIEEGSTLNISASARAADFTYTFIGDEGLSIAYHGVNAEFSDGIYTLSNIIDSDSYPITIQVAQGYENAIVLLSVTDYDNTWEPAGASGVITIPGSQLPRKDTEFMIDTRATLPSETTRSIYLTIDDVNVVKFGMYQGMGGYFGFNDEGKATLTISPTDYTIQIDTSKAITAIESDVEDTFTIPELPSTSVILNLTNAVQGQTISLFTESITLRDDPKAEVNATAGTAIVTLAYSVSNSLVGKEIAILVDGETNSSFTPSEATGSVEFSMTLKEGSNTYEIELKSPHSTTTTTIDLTLDAVEWTEADNNNKIEIFNIQGVRVGESNISNGMYIVNGKKVYIRR